jgi:GT2 family glycosyltransferase
VGCKHSGQSGRGGSVNRPRVSIIIPHYHGDFLSPCLEKLKQSSVSSDTEVIVVVDGSSPSAVNSNLSAISKMLLRQGVSKVIPMPSRQGFGACCNAGAQMARGEIIVFLNDDVLVTAGFLDALLLELAHKPDVAIVCPKILSLRATGFFDYSGAAGGYLDAFGFPFARGRIFGSIEPDHGQYNLPQDIFWASGCCFVMRASVFAIVGGFSEAYFMQMEEVDLCWRVHAQGYRVRSIPASTVLHYGGFSLPENSVAKTYLNHRNSIVLLLRNLPYRNIAFVLSARLALELLAVFWCCLRPKEWRHSVAAIGCLLSLLLRPQPLLQALKAKRAAKEPSRFPGYFPSTITWSYFVLGKKKFSDLFGLVHGSASTVSTEASSRPGPMIDLSPQESY